MSSSTRADAAPRAGRAALTGLLLASLLLAGCFSYRPGPKSRPEPVPVPAGAWPERDIEALEALAEATPETIQVVEPDTTNGSAEEPGGSITHDPVVLYEILGTTLTDHGLLRVYEAKRDEGEFGRFFENLLYGFKRNATFISSYWFERFGQATLEDARAAADRRDEDVRSSRPGFRLARPTPDEMLLVGSNISLGVPTEPSGDLGILVHLPALVGNEYEQTIVNYLEARGWTVLHVESDTTLRGPNHLERVAASNARDHRRMEIIREHPDNPFTKRTSEAATAPADRSTRLTKAEMKAYREITVQAGAIAAHEIPLPETGFEIHPGDDLAAKADLIAETVDQHIADHAYAAEAAVAFIDETMPEMADRPIVVIGFSAGSLAAPTVAARLRELHPDRLAAMVLVGSGAPVLDVARTSRVSDGGLVLTPEGGPPPSKASIDALRELYLERARLDPWNTALALRDLPVLHVFATRDRIVSSKAARGLNEQLGTPDCLVHDGGHLGLFYFLPGQRKRIASWIDRHTESADE